MKHYRIRAIVRGNLLDGTVAAEDHQAALKLFSKKVYDGAIKVKEGPGFYQKAKILITHEEVIDVTAKVSTGKTEVGTSMGEPSVESEHSHPQHAMD